MELRHPFAEGLHPEENVIKVLHSALERNRTNKRSKYTRDTPCTLVTRAYLSWSGVDASWSVESLTKGLNSKDSDVQRFSGLDLDRVALKGMEFIEDDQLIVRLRSGNWRVGDKTRVIGSKFDPWLGTIESFSDDGKVARVLDGDELYVDCELAWLKPMKKAERAA